MDRKTKILLIIATSFALAGCIVFCCVLMVSNRDFIKLPTVHYETNTFEINEEFKDVSIETNTDDIVFAPSDDGKCSVVCYDQNNLIHSAIVKDETLFVQVADTRKWYNYIGINFGQPKITVYLPEREYGRLFVKTDIGDVEMPKEFWFDSLDISVSTGDVSNFACASGNIKIETSTGDIFTQNISADKLELSVSTGKVTAENVNCLGDIVVKVSTGKAGLTNIQCRNFTSIGSTGDLSLKNMIATEKLWMERSTGDIHFDGCDAAGITIITDTGDVTGTLLTEKIFMTETDTGKINVPQTVTGGICQVTTDTGDIRIALQ